MASAHVKSPPLSYAERARRAQNIKSNISAPPPPNTISKSATAASSSSAASTASTAASSVPASSSTDGTTPSSSVFLTATRSSSPLPAPTPDAPANLAKPTVTTASPPELAIQALSTVAPYTSTPAKPPQNVWNLRIEKMAAARAGVSPQSTLASNPTPSSSRSQPNTSNPPSSRSKSPNVASSQCQNAKATTKDNNLSPNPIPKATRTAATSATEVPFVVRPSPSGIRSPPQTNAQLQASQPAYPHSDLPGRPIPDPENWPQVGKSSLLSPLPAIQPDNMPTSSDGLLPSLPLPEATSMRVNGSTIQPSISPRKSEKTKWVPIPPEELQAAADAAIKARAQAQPNSSRKQHPRSGANNTTGNNAAHNTRNHSGRTSAAHSRVQSRAASTHSSPRTGGGRYAGGRKLPADEGNNDIPLPAAQSSYRVVDTNGPPPIHPTSNYSTPPNTNNYQQPSSSTSPLHFPLSHPHPSPLQPQLAPTPTPTHAFHASAPTFYPQGQRSPQPHFATLHPLAAPIDLVNTPSFSPSTQPTSHPSPMAPTALYSPREHGAYYSPAYDFPGRAPPFGPGIGLNASIDGGMGMPAPQYVPGPPMWNGVPPQAHRPVPTHPQREEYVPTAGRFAPAIHVDLVSSGALDVSTPADERPENVNPLNSSISSITTSSGSGTHEKMVFGSITPGETGPSTPSPTEGGAYGHANVNGHANAVEEQDGDGTKEQQNKIAKAEEHLNGEELTKTKAKDGKGKKVKASLASSTSKEKTAETEKEGSVDLKGPTAKSAARSSPTTTTKPPAAAAVRAVQNLQQAEVKQAEVKWKFGTASSTPPVQRQIALPEPEETTQVALAADSVPVVDQHLQLPQVQEQEQQRLGTLHQSNTMPAMSTLTIDNARDAGGNSPISPYPMDPRGSASFAHLSHPVADMTTGLGLEPTLPAPSPAPTEMDPDLAVKDYGFGFGTARLQRELELEKGETIVWQESHGRLVNGGLEGEKNNEQSLEAPGLGLGPGGQPMRDHTRGRGAAGGDGAHTNGRGRRGSFGGTSGGRGYGGGERGTGYGGGRRGRGGINGFSRVYGRGFPRGGSGASGSQRAPHPSGPPPFTVTPPSHLQPLGPMNEGAYYGPPRQQMGPYLPSLNLNGYDLYGPLSPQPQPMGPVPPMQHTPLPHISPPVPVPLSTISFPLDPTRFYLLGQLEYYVSPQNMAQDFFLRQQMDARGWIPIPLIASFNRVKQLTMDAQLVRDVLTLSSLVQVRGNMVRMGGWERFVLPDAAPSSVEEQQLPYVYQNMGTYYDEMGLEQHPHYQQPPAQHTSHGQQLHVNGLNGDAGSTRIAYPHVDQESGQNGVAVEGKHSEGPLINGHTAKGHYSSTSEHEQDDDEDDEDDVVFVMGHEMGTWSSSERHT